MKYNSKGFGSVEIIVSVIIAGLLIGAGWYVWKSNNGDSQKTHAPQTTSTPAKSSTSENEYKSTEYGFAFSYPKDWGTVTIPSDLSRNGSSGKEYAIIFEDVSKVSAGFVTKDWTPSDDGEHTGFLDFDNCSNEQINKVKKYVNYTSDNVCVVTYAIQIVDGEGPPGGGYHVEMVMKKKFERSSITNGIEILMPQVGVKDLSDETLKAAYSQNSSSPVLTEGLLQIAKTLHEI